MQDLNIKRWLESEAYEKKKAEVIREINSNRLVIDYSVFKKTPEERMKLANMKADYKAGRRRLIA